MNYQERKALGLILSADDRKRAAEIAAMIKERTFETMHDDGWQQADRTPALAAEVHNLVMDSPSCNVTAADMLEQFRRYGDQGMARGGKVWHR